MVERRGQWTPDGIFVPDTGDVIDAIEATSCEHCGDFTGKCDCNCECVTCGRKGYEVTFYCGLECEDCALGDDDAER